MTRGVHTWVYENYKPGIQKEREIGRPLPTLRKGDAHPQLRRRRWWQISTSNGLYA